MSNTVLSKTYTPMPYNRKEIRRYAGVSEKLTEIETLIDECIKEISDKLTYKVCYTDFDIVKSDSAIDLGFIKTESKDLAKNLDGGKTVLVFAATIGIEIDRLIAKYGHISPSKALIFQAIGAERIEALCDVFTDDILSEEDIKPRFSAGYGDFPLEAQKDIFAVLDPARRIGLSLNESLLMSPSKSVTAIIGIK